MPIGIGTAIGIGGAVLGAGASIYSASQAGKAQNKAASTAASVAANDTAQNNQLYKDIYQQNTALASPFLNSGYAASGALTDLLLGTHSYNPHVLDNPTTPGGGTYSQFPVGGTTGSGLNSTGQPYTQAQIDAMMHDGIPGNGQSASAANAAFLAAHPQGALAPMAAAPAATAYPGGGIGALTPHPAAVAATGDLHAQAAAAIAQGANPAAVQAQLAHMTSAAPAASIPAAGGDPRFSNAALSPYGYSRI